MAELNKIKDKYSAGDSVELTVYRDANLQDNIKGEYFTVRLTLCDEQKLENELS